MAELLPVADARAAVMAEVRGQLPAEAVPLGEALGRVLAVDAVSGEDVPGWDNSAMDGYAVRSADTARADADSPVTLRLAGESRAGEPAGGALGEGEAFRISTGGVVPAGADAVVRVEDTDQYEGGRAGDDGTGEVKVRVQVDSGRDIRRAGEDIRTGDSVLKAGAVLGSAEVGVLASIGIADPECARRPTLTVVCTGDELLDPSEPMRPGGVRNSNAYTLRALAELAGAEVVSVERCADNPGATRAAMEHATQADVAVFCGGVSVGVHDHVKDAFAAIGIEERFWGVALRPGKPTWFGVGEESLAFGLPGNPVSAMVTFILFVRPALRALHGASPELDVVEAILADDVPRMERRDQAVRCGLTATAEGWLATPTGPQGSHVLTSMLGADALTVVEAGADPATAGSSVRAELLGIPSGIQ
ncbi:MAG TPA: gephyrin-like molybdotransferase Glp [Solirubrobacterales bacterium]|nr:gephyrin-like molybdotransferase Glp [Solirubrobacterales bacterium]